MQSKPERSEGFDVIIRPTLEGAGRTTPEQTGHYSHYNTKLSNSWYFYFVPHSSHWTAVAAILFLEIQWALSPPLYLNKAIARIVLNEGHKLTYWIRCMCLQVFSPCVHLCLIQNELSQMTLNSVWSSTSLCGTSVGTPNPLREAMPSQWSNLRALLSLTLLTTNLIVPSMT